MSLRDKNDIPTFEQSLATLRRLALSGSKAGRPDYDGFMSSADALNLYRELGRLMAMEDYLKAALAPPAAATPEVTP